MLPSAGCAGGTLRSGRAGQPDPGSDPALPWAAPRPLAWSVLLSGRDKRAQARRVVTEAETAQAADAGGRWAAQLEPRGLGPGSPRVHGQRNTKGPALGRRRSSPFLRLFVLPQPAKCWVMAAHAGCAVVLADSGAGLFQKHPAVMPPARWGSLGPAERAHTQFAATRVAFLLLKMRLTH